MEHDISLDEFIGIIKWDKNKFYRNIKKICSNYQLDQWKFKGAGVEKKEDLLKGDSTYVFKKEWKDLAIILFKMYEFNPYSRSNSVINSKAGAFEKLLDYNKETLKLVDSINQKALRREIQLHPTYLATIMETKAMTSVSDKISLLLGCLNNVSIETRTSFWVSIEKIMNDLIIQLHLSEVEMKETIDLEKGDLYRDLLYGECEFNSLDKFVAEVLKKEMDMEYTSKRSAYFEQYEEANIDLDEIFQNIYKDTPEEQKAINDKFESLIGDDILAKVYDDFSEIYTETKIREACALVGESTTIDETLNEYISRLEQHKNEDESRSIVRLKHIKPRIKNIDDNKTKFKQVAENVLTELNAAIIDRKE